MAEKRVSVRLVAEGGRQVRAELEGIMQVATPLFERCDDSSGIVIGVFHDACQRKPSNAMACGAIHRQVGSGRDSDW